MIREVDWTGLLARLVPGEWTDADGADSGVGVSYWYRSDTRFARVGLDQDHVTIVVIDEEGSSETAYEGTLDELGEDPSFSDLVSIRPGA